MSILSIKNKYKFDNEIYDYLNPDNIYIPLYPNSTLEVTKNKLFKGEIVSRDVVTRYSTVSGEIKGKVVLNKKEYLMVENNFREVRRNKKGSKKYICEYNKKELLELLEKYQYDIEKLKKDYKTLIVSTIDIDPFEVTYSTVVNNHYPKVLEALDALNTVLGIENITIVVKNTDNKNVINLLDNIGTYPNISIKMINDIYPCGMESVLIKNVLSKKQIEEGYIFLNVLEVLKIYHILKRRVEVDTTYITVGGDIELNRVYRLKIGTMLNDFIKDVIKEDISDKNIVLNGLMSGRNITNTNLVIDDEIRSIFFVKELIEEEKKCINCGLCVKHCPVSLNPKYLLKHPNKKNKKCLQCGLCTYICPAGVNFKKVLGEKNE